MAEHSYIIRQQDRTAATTFIDDQLSKDPKWFSTTESEYSAAKQEYLAARADSINFNTWCQKWLNETQWMEIRKVISMNKDHKEERRKYTEPHKTISVTHRAWEILSELALQDQLSLSEVIVNRLGNNHATVCLPVESRYNLGN
ncbi:hypothetical protein SAMN05216339_101300 [Nitrosomonas eutropha]|uniref:Organiser of macrodomain of Terminus of chromosome n=1 Tax=Nitrosomonas eutropha TaxID=916 RepID=A0A1I7F5L3_9PROT|nr:hypothetical protein [Nitrosomonas eutropha]SFU31498.1 hypothetical protein SAMN05216339_101300 [Nitrosomonas eutropha]